MAEDQDVLDLLDLKFLPAWLKEAPDKNAYAYYVGEEATRERRPHVARGFERSRAAARRRGPRRPAHRERGRASRASKDGPRPPHQPSSRSEDTGRPAPSPPKVALKIRFLPDERVLENVLAQIKAG